MTKLEKLSPELSTLAKELGYEIYYRGKAYWAGDNQLTYDYYPEGRVTDLKQKVDRAINILQKIKESRNKQRSVAERLKELIDLVQKTTFPRDMFTDIRTPEDDKLTVSPHWAVYTAWLYLVGEPKIEYKEHNSKDEFIKALNATMESYSCQVK